MSEHRITETEELELRERVTVLEEWTASVMRGLEWQAQAVGVALAGVAIALALALALRRRAAG